MKIKKPSTLKESRENHMREDSGINKKQNSLAVVKFIKFHQ
jgi:hypothetical protein